MDSPLNLEDLFEMPDDYPMLEYLPEPELTSFGEITNGLGISGDPYCGHPVFQGENQFASIYDDVPMYDFGSDCLSMTEVPVMEGVLEDCIPMKDVCDPYLEEVKVKRQGTSKQVTIDDLSKHFSMSSIAACKKFNIGKTQFKVKCRALGIKRWPGRKMRSIEKVLDFAKETGMADDDDAVRAAIRTKELVEKLPNMDIGKETRKMRGNMNKRAFQMRRQHASGKKVGGT